MDRIIAILLTVALTGGAVILLTRLAVSRVRKGGGWK